MTYGHRRSNPFVLRTRDPFAFDRPRAVLDLLEFSIRLWPDSKIFYLHDEIDGYRMGLDYHWHPSPVCDWFDATLAMVEVVE